MRYLLFILLLISHLSSAQRWRASIGWLQTNSTIQRADLPTLYDRNKTAAARWPSGPRAGSGPVLVPRGSILGFWDGLSGAQTNRLNN